MNTITKNNSAKAIKLIKSIPEFLLYIKKENARYHVYVFSYLSILAENELLNHLRRFMGSGMDSVDISILETLSLIVQNITLQEDMCNYM